MICITFAEKLGKIGMKYINSKCLWLTMKTLAMPLIGAGMLACMSCSSDSGNEEKPVICPGTYWQAGDTISTDELKAYGTDAFFA